MGRYPFIEGKRRKKGRYEVPPFDWTPNSNCTHFFRINNLFRGLGQSPNLEFIPSPNLNPNKKI
ncbi:hypothetical protein [uncultured Gammaproteobacteria bacterium]|jgi:hypothetical protein|nr:hypothetical protein [uncultured Gammaproteobacteria bacterium]SHN91330.1 hypothetical protein BCLUESOX_1657 [bacterium endosymbiont of Bathymodiolus sp. 5 South]CAC9656088.1 hypothetical protein [uncultured Gammaproteobacteria bacterium]VVH57887.1 hypothetical protein BSPCLSOX_2741 [uncultured Gammaproteobacteria bacterium]VVH62624.1 hypothetical protein BSPWISOX_1573 [uncultured Gammaproteobacteria bacterium]